MSSQDNVDESVSGGSSKASITFSGSIKDWVAAVSIVVNVALGMALLSEYRAKAVAEDLRRDDFTFFKQNDWVHAKTDIEVTKALVAAKCSK